jgi:hypothetical protein
LCLTTVLAVGIGGCSQSDTAPTNVTGVVQITRFVLSPTTFNCAPSSSEIPNIDTVLMQVTMVNTTKVDDTLTVAGSSGTVVASSESADVGAYTGSNTSLPYTPKPAVIEAGAGDVTLRLSLPTAAICRTKALGFVGNQEIDMTARITTSSGQYVTTPARLRVQWVPLG